MVKCLTALQSLLIVFLARLKILPRLLHQTMVRPRPDFSLLAKARAPERGFPTFVFDVFTL